MSMQYKDGGYIIFISNGIASPPLQKKKKKAPSIICFLIFTYLHTT